MVRAPRHFNPLHIPKELQKALPFKSKPKQQQAKGKIPRDLQRPRVIREPHERKVRKPEHSITSSAAGMTVHQLEGRTSTPQCFARKRKIHFLTSKCKHDAVLSRPNRWQLYFTL